MAFNSDLGISQAPAYEFEQITVSTTAVGISATKLHKQSATAPTKDARSATLTVETNPLRFRVDGTDPTAAVGHLLAAGDSFKLNNFDDIRRLKMIRSGAADATVFVTLS